MKQIKNQKSIRSTGSGLSSTLSAQTEGILSKAEASKTKKPKNKLLLESLKFSAYDEVVDKINKKVGKIPDIPDDLPKGEWTQQALRVLEERYLYRDKEGKITETPEGMCWRVAWDIASADSLWGGSKQQVLEQARNYYNLLISREFLPNSPTLMNAGTGNRLQYSACFVLPVGDSLVDIFDAVKYQALIHQSGGGTGFSFSRLRPKGSVVRSSGGVASGPVSFMKIFDAATNEIKQGGKRRGANMGILRIDHPDIMEFIHCKEEGGITNFNISVAVTDKFMEAYKKGGEYELIDPKTKEVAGRYNARQVFDEIAKGAWKTGDPGIIFIDKINNGPSNPVPPIGPIESTNPCGEVPLYPYDSCNLGSIFLTYFVKKDKITGSNAVDWEKLKSVTRLATRFMDGVIEMNPYSLEQIRHTSLAIRRIGLGVGGWADMLTMLGIAYDSKQAIELGENIMKVIYEEAVDVSNKLAKERGPFPLWPISIYKNSTPRRNSTLTTIAPTGSISIIAGSSSGIEPLFAIAYQHIVKDKSLDRTLNFVNPIFENLSRKRGFWSVELMESVGKLGTLHYIDSVPQDIKEIFVTAHEIHQDWHIKTQAVFQKYTENAVSKTINMKHDTSVEDVKRAYLLAWETGCKGITVFRDGCKDAQVLNVGVKDNTLKDQTLDLTQQKEPIQERPFVARGATYKLNTPVGTAFITINHDENGEPLELFINVGKAGSDVTAMAEALGRTISTALRFKGNISAREKAREVAMQLVGIGGRRSVGYGPSKILSLPDAVSAAISMHFGFNINGFGLMANNLKYNPGSSVQNGVNGNGKITNGHFHNDNTATINGLSREIEMKTEVSDIHQMDIFGEKLNLNIETTGINKIGDICPSCGSSSLVFQEGCSKCYACGHSEC